MAKWIEFIEDMAATTKTKKYFVRNKEQTTIIGVIKWHGGFRKYSLFPHANTVWETQCLHDVVAFIERLMIERKLQKQSEKQKG